MQKTWQLCTHTICAYTVSCKRVGVVNWFTARLFETHSEVYINAVYAVEAKRLWFWPWQISLLRESFPALSSRVSEFLFLSLSQGDPAAVRQWMTTESVYHKENYSGLCTKAKTWTQPDSAIHVISSLPSEKSNNKRNVDSRNNSVALLLRSGRPIRMISVDEEQEGHKSCIIEGEDILTISTMEVMTAACILTLPEMLKRVRFKAKSLFLSCFLSPLFHFFDYLWLSFSFSIVCSLIDRRQIKVALLYLPGPQ